MADDKYAICPYNKSHEILQLRMPAHLLKCKKSYKGPPLVACGFNATHLVPEESLKTHLDCCPDAYTFRSSKVYKNSSSTFDEDEGVCFETFSRFVK